MDIVLGTGDWIKIIASIVGAVLIWTYKHQIAKLIGGLIIGDQYSEIKDKTDSQIIADMDQIMGRLQK